MMKRILSLLLCAALLACCASLCVFAEEETTAEAQSQQKPTHMVFNSEMMGKKNVIINFNGMAKGGGTISRSDEWQGIKIVVDDPTDPNVSLDIKKYTQRFGFEPILADAHPFVVLRVYTEDITFDDIHMYYCAGDVTVFSEEVRAPSDYAFDAGNGYLFFVYDLLGDADGAYHTLRVDLEESQEGTELYLTDLAFFENEDAALEWCDSYTSSDETTQEVTGEELPEETNDDTAESTPEQTTAQATTEEVTTQAATEQDTTAEETTAAATEESTTASNATTAPETSAPEKNEGGCGGVIGIGAIVAMIALGAVCFKKRD